MVSIWVCVIGWTIAIAIGFYGGVKSKNVDTATSEVPARYCKQIFQYFVFNKHCGDVTVICKEVERNGPMSKIEIWSVHPHYKDVCSRNFPQWIPTNSVRWWESP